MHEHRVSKLLVVFLTLFASIESSCVVSLQSFKINMPSSKQSMSHREKILEVVRAQAAARKANAAEDTTSGIKDPEFILQLKNIFPMEKRKELSSLTSPNSAQHSPDEVELRDLTEQLMTEGANRIVSAPADMLNMLGRQNYASELSNEDLDKTRMNILKRVLPHTAKDYAVRVRVRD